jgi:flagellar biosynthesis protein FlhB
LLSTFPGRYTEEDEDGSEQEVMPFPSKSVANAALAVVAVASIVTFLSVFGQHISSSTAGVLAQSFSYETLESHVGTVAMILGWGAVLLETLAAIALLLMIVGIRVLSQLAE